MIVVALGARVVAVDLSPSQLERARSIGAAVLVDARTVGDVVAAVQEATAGGAHVSLDALGSSTTCFNSVACLRCRGRHVQVGHMLGAHAESPIPMAKVIAHELELLGSHGMQAWRYEAMVDLMISGPVCPNRLVGDCVDLCGSIARLVGMDADPGTGMTIIDRLS